MKDRTLFYYTMGHFAFCWIFLMQNYDFPIVLLCITAALIGFLTKINNIEVRPIQRNFFLIISVIFFYSYFGTFRGIEPGISLLSIMSAAKIFELKTKRDYRIFLLILELVIMGNILIVDSLLYILFIIISTFFLFYLLFLIEYGQNAKLDWPLKKIYIKMFGLAIVMAIPLFLLFPRINISLFKLKNIGKNPITGFTEELNPGDIAKLYQDDSSVFTATFEKEIPSQEDLYWRGGVLGETDGMSWKKEKRNQQRTHILNNETLYEYTILFKGHGSGRLFNLENVKSLRPISRFHSLETHQGIYQAMPLSKKTFAYKSTTSKVQSTSRPKNLDYYLKTNRQPSFRLKTLLTELAPEGSSQDEKIARLKKFIATNNFIYTYEPGIYQKEQFLDELLFTRKEGFCEHFASSMAILMRFLGIPSRVLVGFQGGTPGHFNNILIVKGRDAHSWIEYWDNDKGWTRFDPTHFIVPERITMNSLDYMSQESIYLQRNSIVPIYFRRIFFQIESVYYTLNTYFLNYDLDAQKSFFKDLFNIEIKRVYLFLATGIFFILFVAVYYFSLSRPAMFYDEHKRIYLKLLKTLKKKRVPIDKSDGPEEVLSKSLPFLSGEQYRELRNITDHYIKLRYDGQQKGILFPKNVFVKLVKSFR